MHSRIALNYDTYPLYVGGNGTQAGLGSGVRVEAIVTGPHTAADITWSTAEQQILAFCEDDGSFEHSRRIGADLPPSQVSHVCVRAVRTGTAFVEAALPDGTRARCTITVIDNHARFTVADIALNTPQLRLHQGVSTLLIPVVWPVDIWKNGMLDARLCWESDDPSVAEVADGTVRAVGPGRTELRLRDLVTGRAAACRVDVTLPGQATIESPRLVRRPPLTLPAGQCLVLPAPYARTSWISEDRSTVAVQADGTLVAQAASVEQRVDPTGLKVKEHPTEITVYATDMDGGGVTCFPVRVLPAPEPPLTLCLLPERSVAAVGVRMAVRLVVCPDWAEAPMPKAEWHCDSPCAVVEPGGRDQDGTRLGWFTAGQPGIFEVAAEMGGLSAKCTIRAVASAPHGKVHLPNALRIEPDQVLRIPATLDCGDSDRPLHFPDDGIAWFRTGPAAVEQTVATVDRQGTVQGYHTGTCRIYAVPGVQPEDSVITDEAAFLAEHGPDAACCTLTVEDPTPWLRNVQAPPAGLTADSALILWNSCAGYTGSYRVFCNGLPVGQTRQLGLRLNGLKPATTYHLRVESGGASRTLTFSTRPAPARVLNVMDFGARGDGRHTDTRAIQAAIRACPPDGVVLLPAGGVFLSGALFLKSRMTLQVEGVLMGSTNPRDYPRVVSRWEGWRRLYQSAQQWPNSTAKVPDNRAPHASLLNIGSYCEGRPGEDGPYTVHHVTLCGHGQINANGFALAYNEGPNINADKVVQRQCPARDATSRGSALRIHNADGVYVRDVQLAYAPGWTVHALYSRNLVFDGLDVISQGNGDCGQGSDILHCGHIYNGDGIDPESCRHVTLFDVRFTTGDDAVAIKSGRNREGNEMDKPNAYFRITDCSSRWSLGGFGTGSETAAGSHDLLFQNLEVEQVLVSGIWIKTAPERGGLTEYIQVRDMFVRGADYPVWVLNRYSSTSAYAQPAGRLPTVRHLLFEQVRAEHNRHGYTVQGSAQCPVADTVFAGCLGPKGAVEHGTVSWEEHHDP